MSLTDTLSNEFPYIEKPVIGLVADGDWMSQQ